MKAITSESTLKARKKSTQLLTVTVPPELWFEAASRTAPENATSGTLGQVTGSLSSTSTAVE
jgi:hypothetical protein